jgi:hypothetical protein
MYCIFSKIQDEKECNAIYAKISDTTGIQIDASNIKNLKKFKIRLRFEFSMFMVRGRLVKQM